jgi:hypothetical protein
MMKMPTNCVEKIMSITDRIVIDQLKTLIEQYGREIDCTWDGKWLRAVYVGYFGYDMKVNVPVRMIRKLHNKYSEDLIDFRYTEIDAMSPHVFNTLNERNNQSLVFVASEKTKKCRLIDMGRVEYIMEVLDKYIINYALKAVVDEVEIKERAMKKAPQVVVPEELLRPYEDKYKTVEVPFKDVYSVLATSNPYKDVMIGLDANEIAAKMHEQMREFEQREWLRTSMRFTPTFIAEPYTYVDAQYPYSDDPFEF